MSFQLYDTAAQQLVTPSWGTDVSLYVCGVTPYDAAHLGHIFTFATYDILQRWLEHNGHQVRLVRNITDVDEPIYARAGELGLSYQTLATRETTAFQDVMTQLDMRPAFGEPKASDYITHMITAVGRLIEAGIGYQLANGDVYFDTAQGKDYGQRIAHFNHKLELKLLADRGGDPERSDKRHPMDFQLWKAVPDASDPARWPSPFGHGRPGWHIECSVMSADRLGEHIDLHGGGLDLVWPHHESELAQNEALGSANVSNWMHVAPLNYHGEKMSKSLGNLVFAADLLKTYEPAVIRLALLRYHYQVGGEWHPRLLSTAQKHLSLLRAAAQKQTDMDMSSCKKAFEEAMDNNLHTPDALRHLLRYAEKVIAAPDGTSINAIAEQASILGINIAN